MVVVDSVATNFVDNGVTIWCPDHLKCAMTLGPIA